MSNFRTIHSGMVLVPEHVVKRLSAYYKVGGFFREGKPPILVLNALDDITHYDYGEPIPHRKPFRRVKGGEPRD